jgi:lipopolysaccharide/colanic/teichoic acid biosynthesis glycosyltransferase
MINSLDQESVETENSSVILPYEITEEFYIEPLGEIKRKPCYDFFKRVFDIVVSAVALIILLIPMLILAIAIKCVSKGPVLFFQDRLGLNGKVIRIVKFRTMHKDAEVNGAQWSMGDDDPRIFPLGRVLRKCRADELPQLWCILRGDLSFVGPRPERECFHKEFEKYIHGFGERLKVKQGLTGYAQVMGGYDLKPEEKILYDVEYIKNRSFLLDMKIILKTIGVVLKREGAK